MQKVRKSTVKILLRVKCLGENFSSSLILSGSIKVNIFNNLPCCFSAVFGVTPEPLHKFSLCINVNRYAGLPVHNEQ